ncbi:MAG TPA: T9SS type A sorting domain-containing protein, partial [Cryomorphaceae bacterium]|nr:T9SS type A sorting domain-containing protein [Cryomorphaceae bacterium]
TIIGDWSEFDFFDWNVAAKALSAEGSGVTIYPNPAQSELNVALTIEEGGMYAMTFFDLQGRSVKEKIVEMQSNQNLRFDISDLESGVYLFQVSNGKVSFTEKFIKQ